MTLYLTGDYTEGVATSLGYDDDLFQGLDVSGTEILAESDTEMKEPTNEDLLSVEKCTPWELKYWNIVTCRKCKGKIDILNCKYDEGNVVCPHCKKLN